MKQSLRNIYHKDLETIKDQELTSLESAYVINDQNVSASKENEDNNVCPPAPKLLPKNVLKNYKQSSQKQLQDISQEYKFGSNIKIQQCKTVNL